ncbi:MAG: uridine kinase [Clostridia bacterium]|nr:uridine kinase [Clostridia bacterium]
MNSVYIIGIAGGSGSGKSTFARRLTEKFPDSVSLVSCDNYYKAHDDIPLEERRLLNYDAPEALEFDLMVSHLRALKEGRAVDCPVYDFTLHNRSDKVVRIDPRPVIIVDGILILSDPALRETFDLKIYVETDADERILRRARRDMEVRGRKIDDIMAQYLNTVKPMHETHVEPSKKHADLILNGGLNPVALEVVESRVRDFLDKRG